MPSISEASPARMSELLAFLERAPGAVDYTELGWALDWTSRVVRLSAAGLKARGDVSIILVVRPGDIRFWYVCLPRHVEAVTKMRREEMAASRKRLNMSKLQRDKLKRVMEAKKRAEQRESTEYDDWPVLQRVVPADSAGPVRTIAANSVFSWGAVSNA